MGETRRRRKVTERSKTLPSSPTHSSSASSSDFEFTISISPRTTKSSNCPADELFYKGKLLPLHLSPRLSMVRTLLLASSSTSSSSDTTTIASRDSSGSSTDSQSSFTVADCDSSRPSSVAEDDEFKRLNGSASTNLQYPGSNLAQQVKKSKYFSLSRFSSVFRKSATGKDGESSLSSSSTNLAGNNNNNKQQRMNSSATDVIRKYLKKVKPLYEKLSQTQKQQHQKGNNELSSISTTVSTTVSSVLAKTAVRSEKQSSHKHVVVPVSHSFSGNLRYPGKRNCASSCPSSMRSSPNHSGVLTKTGVLSSTNGNNIISNTDSSMEELQSAIQGAIAHCKNSMMIQNKTMIIGSCSKDI